jgi:hypothetical protein
LLVLKPAHLGLLIFLKSLTTSDPYEPYDPLDPYRSRRDQS